MARSSTLGRLLAPLALVVFAVCSRAWAEHRTISGAPLVYLRSGPGPEYRPVGVLSEGAEVEVLEDRDRWVKVRTAAGEEGFVFGTFVAAPSQGAAAAPPAAEAETAPAPSSVSAPMPSTTAAPEAPIAEEVARLRAELEELKAQVHRAAGPDPRAGHHPAAPEEGTPESEAPTEKPTSDFELLGVSALSLAVGWVLGVLFARRRSRVQRNRLRF